MKKRFLALIMIAMLAFSLAACGGGSSDSGSGDANSFAGGQKFAIKIGDRKSVV